MKLKITYLLDATQSMGNTFKSVTNTLTDVITLNGLFENAVESELIIYRDYDSPNNGISIHPINSRTDISTFMSQLRVAGGGAVGCEASCTALLTAMSRIDSRKHSGALLYLITDEGGRFYEGEDSVDINEKKNFERELAYFPEFRKSCWVSDIAFDMVNKNAKLTVIYPYSPSHPRDSLSSFYHYINLEKALEVAEDKWGTGEILRIHMLRNMSSSSSKSMNELFEAASHNDLMCSMLPIDIADVFNTQSLFGQKLKTKSKFERICNEMNITTLEKSSLEGRCNKFTNTGMYDSRNHCLVKDYLSFSIFPNRVAFDSNMLMGENAIREIIQNEKLAQQVVHSKILGPLIKGFINQMKDKRLASKCNSSLEAHSGFNELKNSSYALLADSFISDVISECHHSNPLFFIENSNIQRLLTEYKNQPQALINMCEPEVISWYTTELLPKIQICNNNDSSSSSSSSNYLSDKKRLSFIPSKIFKRKNGNYVSPVQLLCSLLDKGITFNDINGSNVLYLSFLIVNTENTVCPELVNSAIETIKLYDFSKATLDNSSKLFGALYRKHILQSKYRNLLPARIINTLVGSLQLDQLLLILRFPPASGKLQYVTKLAEVVRNNDGREDRKLCKKCNVVKNVDCFEENNYCMYCSICYIDNTMSTTKTVLNALSISLKKKDIINNNNNNKNNKALDDRFKRLGFNETVDVKTKIFLHCKICERWYHVWYYNKAPVNEMSHSCPHCRVLKLIDEKKKLVPFCPGIGLMSNNNNRKLITL